MAAVDGIDVALAALVGQRGPRRACESQLPAAAEELHSRLIVVVVENRIAELADCSLTTVAELGQSMIVVRAGRSLMKAVEQVREQSRIVARAGCILRKVEELGQSTTAGRVGRNFVRVAGLERSKIAGQVDCIRRKAGVLVPGQELDSDTRWTAFHTTWMVVKELRTGLT